MLHMAWQLNIITTCAMIVSAAVGVFIAGTFFAQRAEYELQRTIRLVDDWFRKSPDDVLSPFEALTMGRRTAPTLVETLRLEEERYAVIDFYFQNAWFLYKKRMLNGDYFLGRMARIVLWARKEMKGLENILRAEGKLPDGPSSISLIAEAAETYARSHGFYRESDKDEGGVAGA
jgi:hypothetical protein